MAIDDIKKRRTLDELMSQATAPGNMDVIASLAGPSTDAPIPAPIIPPRRDQIEAARNLNRKLDLAGFRLPTSEQPMTQASVQQQEPMPTNAKPNRFQALLSMLRDRPQPRPSTMGRVNAGIAALGAGLKNIGRTAAGKEGRVDPFAASQRVLQASTPRQPDVLGQIKEGSAVLQFGDMLSERDPNSPKSIGLKNYLLAKGFQGALTGRSYRDVVDDPGVQEFLKTLRPADPKEQAQIEKLQAETALKQAEVERLGTEEERKKALVDRINSTVGENVATIEMDFDTLNSMAKEAGLHTQKLQRARAAGGVSGKSVVYDAQRRPQLASLMGQVAQSDAKYLPTEPEQDLYTQIMSDPSLPPEQKRQAVEPQQEKIRNIKERLRNNADKTLQKINDPEKGVNQLLSAMAELRSQLQQYPDAPGWNEISSALRNSGRLGSWGVNAFASIADSIGDTTARTDLLAAIKNLNDSYGRLRSGAAIPPSEMDSFADQLGSGAFSNTQTLKSGLNRAERVLRRAVAQSVQTGIDERILPEYINQVGHLLPRDRKPTITEIESKF